MTGGVTAPGFSRQYCPAGGCRDTALARVVVGYLGAPQPEVLPALVDAVHAYAARHRLGTVEAVYRDTPGDRVDGELPRGWERCLRDLHAGRAHTVIVHRREDIAADPAARASILAMVRAAGGIVHVMNTGAGSWR